MLIHKVPLRRRGTGLSFLPKDIIIQIPKLHIMKKLFPFLAILLLMLTLAVSCQKDEIIPAKNEDQVALRR